MLYFSNSLLMRIPYNAKIKPDVATAPLINKNTTSAYANIPHTSTPITNTTTMRLLLHLLRILKLKLHFLAF